MILFLYCPLLSLKAACGWFHYVYLRIRQKEWWWTSHSSNLMIKLMVNQKNWKKSSVPLKWGWVWGLDRWAVAYKWQGYQYELRMSCDIFLSDYLPKILYLFILNSPMCVPHPNQLIMLAFTTLICSEKCKIGLLYIKFSLAS